MKTRRAIAISGNIGAGKSSMVEFLSNTYDVRPFYEPNEDNPYLEDFYTDMKRWAFSSQMYFLSNKFRIHQELDQCSGAVVQDRTIYEDAQIFATALRDMKYIDDRDWATYWQFYQTILNAIQPPDLMIYLRCSMRALRKRIKLRGRDMEQDIPLAYLKRLDKLYEAWFERYDRSPVLIIETDKIDYVNDLIHRLDVMEQIEDFVALRVTE